MISRRTIIGAAFAAAGRAGTAQGIRDLVHIKLHGDKTTYCGHPRQGGIFYFGGYHSRSVLMLQRSLDGGRTWPASHEVVVANEAAPLEERQAFLLSAFTA